MVDEFDRILGPGGRVARKHPHYEHRPGQIRMAAAVAEALAEQRHLCVEAGTGTGKTLAYLLPAIFSRKRVIISTGTKNLQEQIFFKDLPFLGNALDKKLSACYLKGRSNYLCLKKLEEIDAGGYLFSRHDPEYLKLIRKWSRESETGDRAELKELPDELPLWRHVDARRETCTGQKCPDFERCFVTRARQRALESDIVIVNHHLFFADLALRQGDFGSVLPDYSAVVFDEAHEIEDVATQYFGVMVSNFRIDELVRDTHKEMEETGSGSVFLQEQLARLTACSGEFFRAFARTDGRFSMLELGEGRRIRRAADGADGLEEAYREVSDRLRLIHTGLEGLPVGGDVIEALIRRTEELSADLSLVMESESHERVYWYENRGRGVFLWASPIVVAPIMEDRLFSKVDTAVLTSATLSTGGNFRFIRERLGLRDAAELIVGSHFDYSEQAVLYIPRDMPEPREPGWSARVSERLVEILEASRGRAFVLFTSFSQMELAYQAVKGRVPFPVFIQGERSKTRLLDDFRETPHSVLFATASFWQGVDVQGEQLSCVVIDKLPFSVPSDPVVSARIRYINEAGGNAFYDYQVPEAIILLKQGFGRLIRSRSDRGILALLDKRVLTRSYGRTFLGSLPRAPLTDNVAELRNFLEESGSEEVGKEAPDGPF